MSDSVGREPKATSCNAQETLAIGSCAAVSQRANSPASNANHNTQFCKACTTGFSAFQHLSTRSRSRTPRETAIWCNFTMLMLRTPRSTPETNVQCSPAFSASCSWVNPSFSRRIRIVFPRGFLGSVIGAFTHRWFRLEPGKYIVYSLCTRKSTAEIRVRPAISQILVPDLTESVVTIFSTCPGLPSSSRCGVGSDVRSYRRASIPNV